MSNNVNVIVSGPNNNATSQYKTLILKSAKTFKELVTLPNTKYVIRYDFDLNGETITIPTGSILEFDGGMVSNGTLVGLNTKILNLTNTDSLDVTLEGTFEEVGLINKDNLLLKESQTLTTLEKDTVVENILSKNSSNGMGRIILKENITNGINTLTLSMMTLNNTIYVIQYDFTLGENITIPSNCVLDFDGGSIGGEHTITGQNTGINAGLVKIFNTEVTLAGSWNVAEVYPEWFGAKGDGVTDDTDAIERCLVLKIPAHFTKSYCISPSLHIYNNIYGKGELIFEGAGYGLFISNVNNICISGIVFNANNNPIDIFRVENVNNLIIQNCVFKDIAGTGSSPLGAIQINSIDGFIVSNSSFLNITNTNNFACYGINISSTQAKNIRIENCTFDEITSTEDADCIKIVGNTTTEANVVIENCTFSDFGKRAVKSQATNVTTKNNTIYVNAACYTCIDFQRGGGRSLNDTIYVNYGSGFISGLFKLGGSNNILKGLRVYYLQGTSDASNNVITIDKDGEGVDTIVKNVVIDDVIATGLKYFLRISAGITEIENLCISRTIHTLSTDDGATYYSIYIRDANTLESIKNSYIELSFPTNGLSNDDTKFVGSTIKSFGNNLTYMSLVSLREKNIIDFNTNYDVSLIKSVSIKQNKGIFYARQDFSINNNTTSAALLLRGSKIGDIVYVPAVNTDGNIKVGYICTADGTASASGTFKDYII